jgi:DNA-binding NarL/FixJ family response regulator
VRSSKQFWIDLENGGSKAHRWATKGIKALEVQKELQAVSPKGRVVISTANDHDSVQNAAIQAGAVAYFVKRFDDEAFSLPSSHGLEELNVLTAPF